jgi:hypothetical protein
VWTSILLARRILPPGAALFAGLVLAVPSLHAVTWALGGNLMCPATFLLGHRVTEVPIVWRDDNRSNIRLVRDSGRMLLDLGRVRLNGWTGRYALRRPRLAPLSR